MNLFYAKIITISVSLCLGYGIFSPLGMACLYIIIRPLLQPFGTLHYMIAGQIPLNSLFSISFIYFTVIGVFFRRTATFFAGNVILLYILFLCMLLSFFDSIYPVGTIAALVKILTGVAFYLVGYNCIQKEGHARQLLCAIMISSVIPMLYGYFQFASGTGHAWKGVYYAGSRIDSVLGQYNEYGIYLAGCLICSLTFFLRSLSKRTRFLSLLIIISQVISIILSKNRGTWIALGLSFMITSTIFFRRINKKVVIPLVAAMLIVASSIIIERFQELFETSPAGFSGNTLAGRISLWVNIMPYALQKPFTGWGLGSAPYVMQKYFGKALFPHNDYLLLAFEAGFVTLVTFLFYLLAEYIFFIKQAIRRKSWPVDFAALTLLIYYSVISFTQNIIFNQVLFPLLVGSFAILRRYSILIGRK